MVQAYKTNGRVTRLDSDMKMVKHVSDYAAAKVKEVETTVRDIKKETWVVRWMQNHPKKFIGMLSGLLFVSASMGTEYGPPLIQKGQHIISLIKELLV